MSVNIQWQPPVVLEERKKAQWEKIIRHELGEIEDPLDVNLSFEAESLRWKVETVPGRSASTRLGASSRDRVVDALRAAGKPAV
jgi:hypothetical protein